jgi:hypothetical protein
MSPAQPARKPSPMIAGSAGDEVALFSAGVISRQAAMRALKVSYGELLDIVAARSLPLPRVSDPVAERMAEVVARSLDDAAR